MTYLNKLTREDRQRLHQAKIERIARTNSRYQQCDAFHPSENLQMHHLTYERLGHERDEDLVLLCKECHRAADRERERAQPQFESRLRAWAMKTYGAPIEELPHRRIDLEEKYFRAKESKQGRR